MKIEVETEGNLALFSCEGEFNLAAGAEINGRIDELGHELRVLILDLRGITFIDSSGIGQLVAIYKKCSIDDRSFALSGLTPSIAQILSITKLDKVFSIFESADAAKASFAG